MAPDLPSARLGPLPPLLLPSVTPLGALLCPGACDTVSATPLPRELVAVRAVGAQLDVKECQCLLSVYMAVRQRHRAELTLGYKLGLQGRSTLCRALLGRAVSALGFSSLGRGVVRSLGGAYRPWTCRAGPVVCGGEHPAALVALLFPCINHVFFYPTYGA